MGKIEPRIVTACKESLAACYLRRAEPPTRKWRQRPNRGLADAFLLGLLANGPKSTLEIRDVGWDAACGQLDKVLKALLRQGLIERRRAHRLKIGIYRYSLTEAGWTVQKSTIEFCRGLALIGSNCSSSDPDLTPPVLPPLTDDELDGLRRRSPTPAELDKVLSLPTTSPSLRRICRALQQWPYESSDLLALTRADIDSEGRFVYLPQGDGQPKRPVAMSPHLRLAVLDAMAVRNSAPHFRARRGGPFSEDTLRHDRYRKQGPSSACRLFLRALACNVMPRSQLAALRFSDVDIEGRKVWAGEGENRIALGVSGDFLKALREAAGIALAGPVFESSRASKWSYIDLSAAFRERAREAGLPETVVFPGHSNLRRALVAASGALESGDDAPVHGSDLILYDDRAPEIGGVPQPFLSDKGNLVVRALVSAGSRGLTKDQLADKSCCGDARGVLTRLRKSSLAWASVIDFPGKSHGRYRIRGRRAENGHPH
jgi:integrase